jgi:hypothetical protein
MPTIIAEIIAKGTPILKSAADSPRDRPRPTPIETIKPTLMVIWIAILGPIFATAIDLSRRNPEAMQKTTPKTTPNDKSTIKPKTPPTSKLNAKYMVGNAQLTGQSRGNLENSIPPWKITTSNSPAIISRIM